MSYKAENLAVSPGHLVYAIHMLLKKQVDVRLAAAGIDLGMEEYPILNSLWHQDGKNQQELAAVISKDRARTSRLIDQLEQKRLVYRTSHPSSRREKIIRLTPTGNAIKPQVEAAIEQAIQDGFGWMSPANYSNLIATLQRVKTEYIAMQAPR